MPRCLSTIGPLSAVVFLGCSGQIGAFGGETDSGHDDPTSAPVPSPASFECRPNREAPPQELRRLTRVELENALRDVFADLDPSTAGWVPGVVDEVVDQVPPDLATEALDYRRMSQEVSQAHVDGAYAVARRLGEALTANRDRLGTVVGDCAVDGDAGNDDACLDGWVQDLGRLTFRRPLTQDEIALYVEPIDPAVTDIAGRVRLVTTALLMSPAFHYQLELGADPVDGVAGAYELTSYELASRLALAFWRSIPDEALLAAARSGDLATDEGYAEQVDRMLADPRAERAFEGFVEDWLTLHRVPDLDGAVDRADFRAYAGEDLPDAALRGEALGELLAFARHVYTDDGTLGELFLGRDAYVESDAVAALYGVEPSVDGMPVALPAGERAGILTRVAVLANDQATTRPILRGVRVLTRVLCDEVELPENMDDIQLPANDGARSTRQKVADLTMQEGSICANCHTAINPLGFSFEGYDGLGRVRSVETVYGPDGEVVSTFPVDSTADVRVTSGPESIAVSDGVTLSEALADSPKVEACFARQLTRHVLGREDEPRADGCLLEDVRTVLADGGSIRDGMRALALSPAFRRVQK